MTPHTDAATTLAGIRSIRERRRKYHYYADKLPSVEPGTQVYRDYQFILADYEGATGEELDILLDTVAALQRQLDDAQARERAAKELLHSLDVAYRFFMTDLPDDEVISIGKWTQPVPGWHSQFDAKLKLTVGDFRKAFAATAQPADGQQQAGGE